MKNIPIKPPDRSLVLKASARRAGEQELGSIFFAFRASDVG